MAAMAKVNVGGASARRSRLISATLVNGVLEGHPTDGIAHALAAVPENVDGEELARQLDDVERQLQADQQICRRSV